MKIGIIGGSGLYAVDGLENVREVAIETPFGSPSDVFVTGTIGAAELVFLARHGRQHHLLPGELNHRANVYAMKRLGVEAIVSISAVGSFRESLVPGDMVLVDQFVDRTRRRTDLTFFGDGVVAHIGFARPGCAGLREQLFAGIRGLLHTANPNGVSVHSGGTYLNMEGPAFSTLAESMLYKSWGMDVIGMTNLGEAKLAREAEICYQTIAFVTDYDCWHHGHESVTVEMIVKTLMQNADMARRIVRELVPGLSLDDTCECRHALATAIITPAAAIPAAARERLAPIIGKYLPA